MQELPLQEDKHYLGKRTHEANRKETTRDKQRISKHDKINSLFFSIILYRKIKTNLKIVQAYKVNLQMSKKPIFYGYRMKGKNLHSILKTE